MKKINNKVSLFSAVFAIALVAIFGVGYVVKSYSGAGAKVVVEGNMTYNEAVQTAEQAIGANPGTDHYSPERFRAGFGGNVLTTSTIQSTITLTEDELYNNSVFEITSLMKAAVAVTFPATSTLSSILLNPGDTQSWTFRNRSTSTSATVLTITKGTGWDLTGVDTNVDTIAADGWGVVNCYRESASSTYGGMSNATALSIMCEIRELVAAD
jgi:hypothetical protein